MTIIPGVRLTASKSGLGISVGPRGAHLSLNTSGRMTASAGIPGSGLSYVKTANLRSQRRQQRQVQQAATEPRIEAPHGPTEPAWAATLWSALFEKKGVQAVRAIQQSNGPERGTALYVELLAFALPERVEARMTEIFNELEKIGYDAGKDAFVQEYLTLGNLEMTIAKGMRAHIPLSNPQTWQLSHIEFIQAAEPERALALAEGLEPTTLAGASLAEMYIAHKRWEDVLMLTTGVTNADDAGAYLMVQRAIALRELDRLDDAHRLFATITTSRKTSRELRSCALEEWDKTRRPAKGAWNVAVRRQFAQIVELTVFEQVVGAFGLISLLSGNVTGIVLFGAALGVSIAVRRFRKPK